MSPAIQAPRPDAHAHSVQFYESDRFLVGAVAAFLHEALASGRGALTIATAEHQGAIDAELAERGLDLESVRSGGRYISCDARTTLDRIAVDGIPKKGSFERIVVPLLQRLDTSQGRPHLFGEMVDLLWGDGYVEGALRLEDLWNELRLRHPFSLLCGYTMHHFGSETDSGDFSAVIDRHTEVHPGEGWSRVGEDDVRAISLLEQRAFAIEQERARLSTRQQELEDAVTRLAELDRIRNDYVAMLMHDIKAPNAIVSGSLHLLRDNRGVLSEQQTDDVIARAIRASGRIMRLADDLLTVARLESGHFNYDKQVFDLADVAYRAVSDVRGSYPDRRFELELDEKLPAAYGDPSRQIQIFTNLLSNAAKYSPPGSTVHVSVSRSGAHLVASIKDEGVGISPEDQSRLFQRYTRVGDDVQQETDGTGLGLYIAKALVEGQGGTIRVDSRLGAGATFSFTVPTATF